MRRAEPADAAALVELARTVGGEPEGWLISDRSWRSVSEERRYLKALRRYAHAAVFVAEAGDEVVGRLSVARDPHPASRHVADLGLMVDAGYRLLRFTAADVLSAPDSVVTLVRRALSAARHRLCDGSVEQLLVGMVDNEVIDKKDLAMLARKIAKRKTSD